MFLGLNLSIIHMQTIPIPHITHIAIPTHFTSSGSVLPYLLSPFLRLILYIQVLQYRVLRKEILYMSDNDISMLKLVNECGDMADLGFYRRKDIGADSRLEALLSSGLIRRHSPSSDNSYIGDFEITGKGYAFLSDYQLSMQKSEKAKKQQLISNIYIPLAVTIASNLIIELIKVLLL